MNYSKNVVREAIASKTSHWENDNYSNMMMEFGCQEIMPIIEKTFNLKQGSFMFDTDNIDLEDALHSLNAAVATLVYTIVAHEDTVTLPTYHGKTFSLADNMGNEYKWNVTQLSGYVNFSSGTYFEPDEMNDLILQNDLHIVQ